MDENSKSVHIRVVVQNRQKNFGRNIMVGVFDYLNRSEKSDNDLYSEILNVAMEIAWRYGFGVLVLAQGVDNNDIIFENSIHNDNRWNMEGDRTAVARQDGEWVASMSYVENMKEYLTAFDDLRSEHGAAYGEVVYRN